MIIDQFKYGTTNKNIFFYPFHLNHFITSFSFQMIEKYPDNKRYILFVFFKDDVKYDSS